MYDGSDGDGIDGKNLLRFVHPYRPYIYLSRSPSARVASTEDGAVTVMIIDIDDDVVRTRLGSEISRSVAT